MENLQAKDLRIGNKLIFSNGIEPDRIITVGRRFFSSAAIEKEDGNFTVTPYYKPIPLTEDILVKAGFEKDNTGFTGDDYFEWMQKEFPIIGFLVQSENKEYLFDENTDTLRIRYLHEIAEFGTRAYWRRTNY